MSKRKSWTEKLKESKGLPKVEKITEKMSKRWGSGTVAIPAPMEVDKIMKNVPEGKLVSINEIRAALARRHGATIGCPITTGIFAWIAANAAEEQRQKGEKNITPYWRTLKAGGVINEKYPGDFNRGWVRFKCRFKISGLKLHSQSFLENAFKMKPE